MKRFLKGILGISGIALLMLASCKKDGALVTTNGGTAGKLTPSTTTPVLEKSKVTDTTKIITFNFTPAQYTFSAASTYALQIDADGDNWKNPTSVSVSTKSTTQSYNTADFNNILLKLNLTAGVPAKVNVRMQYSLSTSVNAYSNVTSLTVTPFNLTSWIYVVGQFQGWNISAPDSLISLTGNGIYTGVISFPKQTGHSNGFLVVPAKSWSNKYATTANPDTLNADNSSAYATEYVTGGGNNFFVKDQGGAFIVTININTNVLTIVPANYYSVIGDAALGWGTDTEMKYINDGNGVWAVTLPLVSTGSFKIRENNDWTYSWGIPKPGEAGDGILNTLNDTKNNNISVAASGNYLVTLNYPATAVSATFTPATTVTYSVTKQ